MVRVLTILIACLGLAACGGGGGGGGGSTATTTPTAPTPPTPTLTNFTTISVDAGPSALSSGGNNFYADDLAFVSVTLCAPGTSNCQTIDHVQVDTGSVGLRILNSVLSPALLSALPVETDASANPVGECYGYVSGYAFGSVRQADFQIGGEKVANMPLQVVGDTGVFSNPPSSCSSGGGSNLKTVVDFSANGIIGIGVSGTDCGANCTVSGGYGAAVYYDCPTTGCSSITTRAANTSAPFQQLPNPVAAMAVDNNGTIISLPAVPAPGLASISGTLTFGIGTQTNNGFAATSILDTSNSSSSQGAGLLTVLYNGQTLNQSYIDSGTNLYLFTDSSIAACTDKENLGYYCPASPLTLTPQILSTSNSYVPASFVLYNADTLFSTANSAVPGVGANPNSLSNLMDFPRSFAFGLPFFFGRNIYTAIEGRNAGGVLGPYIAY